MKTQSEIDGTPYPANCSTIIQQFDAVVKQYPHNLAVICTHQPRNLYELGRSEKKPCLEWTYDTLNHAVGSFVSSIASHGLPPGTPFFLLCQNRIEYLVATLAAYHLGYKHVPLNPEHLSNPNDIQYAIDLVLRSDTQESAVILASNTVAENIDLLAIPRGTIKIAMDGDCDGWIPFESFLKEVSTNKSIMSPSHESTVLFTSGSTGRPKGCLISADRWFSALSAIMTWGSIEPSDVVAMTLPNQHAFGHICIIMPLLRGACLVYPGPKFEPATAAKGIIQHRCTHVPLVATMLPSLMEMISPSEAMSLKGFVFGAMVLSPDLLQSCVDHFGLAYFENLYGMTEGVFASTGPITSMDLIKSDIGLSIGSPVSGCIMRVCGVDDRVPVPRGTVGQLHVSGYTTVKSYIGRNTTDFYVKDGRQWFITGDAAILHEDDQLYLVGRYKDMIIRGGENITPSRIEALLHGVPSLEKLLPQIVGQQDPIAGEVPVAVVKEEISSCEVKLLKDTVREALGPIHTPTQVIPLQKLGIEDYPKSQANKIIKPELQRLVKVYRRSESSQDDSSSALQVKVTTAWARSLGLDPQEIDIQSKLSDFADSILMLTARDAVRKSTGQSAPLEAWLKAETIAHQIALLRKSTGNRSHRTADASKTSMAAPSLPTSKPPSVEDMVHLGDNQEAFSATKLAVQETITPFGLFWHDVTDVYPCPDFIQEVCKSKVIDTWNIRTTVVSNTSVEVSLGFPQADELRALTSSPEHAQRARGYARQ
jgi:acyl-CoA synthetase (AMP-forming)/AMP-acid ligase II